MFAAIPVVPILPSKKQLALSVVALIGMVVCIILDAPIAWSTLFPVSYAVLLAAFTRPTASVIQDFYPTFSPTLIPLGAGLAHLLQNACAFMHARLSGPSLLSSAEWIGWLAGSAKWILLVISLFMLIFQLGVMAFELRMRR